MAEYIIKVGEEGYEKPTVIQELVRCKDCKWCNMGECEHKLGLIWANDENYCNLGEWKEGDNHD